MVYGPEFFDAHRAGSVGSAERIAPLVLELVTPKSVIDVGCGVGTWLKTFMTLGVEDSRGVDGDWVRPEQLLIPRDRFTTADLSRPIPADRAFDLAVSMEVAEHLPAESADGFVDSLTRLAPVVLFSAAIPGQGGTHHVNEQWPGYWADKFAARGFVGIDCLRRRIWTDPGVEWWYAQNAVVYASEDGLARHARLREARASNPGEILPLVHPGCLAANAPKPMGFKRLLRQLPSAFASSMSPRRKA